MFECIKFFYCFLHSSAWSVCSLHVFLVQILLLIPANGFSAAASFALCACCMGIGQFFLLFSCACITSCSLYVVRAISESFVRAVVLWNEGGVDEDFCMEKLSSYIRNNGPSFPMLIGEFSQICFTLQLQS